MALVNAYCTVQDLRDHFDDAGTALSVGLLETAINAASRRVDTYCNRRFWRDATVTTRTFAVDDPAVAWLEDGGRAVDVSTTAGLIVKSDPDLDGTFGTTWTSGEYQLEPLNSSVVAGGDTVTPHAWWRIVTTDTGVRYWPFAPNRPVLSVTARFGWSAVPDEVRYATILKAAALYKRRDAPWGVAGFGEFGAVRIAREDSDVASLLGPYVYTRPRSLVYAPQRSSLFHGRGWGG